MVWLASSLAMAEPTVVEGTLVAVDGHDLVVDLGGSRGIVEGEMLELWRPLRVKHPVTGKVLVDRFRIGSLRVGQVQRTLSLARPDGETTRQPAAGDVVLVRRALTSAPPLPAPASSAGAAAHEEQPRTTEVADPEARELSALFEELRGKDPMERVRKYQEFAARHPEGRYSATLREEAALLVMRAAVSRGATEVALLKHAAPDEVRADAPLRLAFVVEGATAGVLHVRAAGQPAYVSTPLVESGRGYLVATVDPSLVRAPGFAYFAEATDEGGRTRPLFRAADAPREVAVRGPATLATSGQTRTAAMFGEYALYGPAKPGNDYVWQTEGAFGARLGDVGLRAVRSGFGVLRGAGGSLKELDEQGAAPRRVGLTYGYVEVEVAPERSWALIGRGIVGLRNDGLGGGAQSFVRVGSDRTTNLLIGGEVLGGVGLRGIAELTWRTIPRVPIVLRSEVTNQPAGGGGSPDTTVDEQGRAVARGTSEVGARAIVQVGYRVTDALELAVRASYQGRTIHHAGPGFGAGATYTW